MTVVWQRFKDGTFLALRADRLPHTVWGSNLRAFFPRNRWQELSRLTSDRADGKCEVCGRGPGERPNLDCNEMWEFIDEGGANIQRLVGVIAMCEWCHLTQHSGRAHNMGRFEDVMMVLMAVNNWTHTRAMQDFDDSVADFRVRSEYAWDLDISVLDGWVELAEMGLRISAVDRARLGNAYTQVRSETRPVFDGDIPNSVWDWNARVPVKRKADR